jgi:hypothetical protein
MITWKVVYTEQAEQDLRGIYKYSPMYGGRDIEEQLSPTDTYNE